MSKVSKKVIRRKRILSLKDRQRICLLYESDAFTMTDLAQLFSVTQPRISQIVSNYYGERDDF